LFLFCIDLNPQLTLQLEFELQLFDPFFSCLLGFTLLAFLSSLFTPLSFNVVDSLTEVTAAESTLNSRVQNLLQRREVELDGTGWW